MWRRGKKDGQGNITWVTKLISGMHVRYKSSFNPNLNLRGALFDLLSVGPSFFYLRGWVAVEGGVWNADWGREHFRRTLCCLGQARSSSLTVTCSKGNGKTTAWKEKVGERVERGKRG
jgi:hypothetical protein